jgi:kynurenine formamidase
MILKITVLIVVLLLEGCPGRNDSRQSFKLMPNLWQIYDQTLKKAKYVDLTHTLTPSIPVWKGFGRSKFGPTVDPATGKPYTYEKDGFEATHYDLSTDQLGTQLDPPAHWAPEYPAIDELPATYPIRPLVVISIVDKVSQDPGYQLKVDDILEWENRNGQIPAGSVVFIRSDWSKEWPDPKLATKFPFPGVIYEVYSEVKRSGIWHP